MMPTGTAPYIATQLPLGVQLRDDASFASYEAGPNAELLQSLQALVTGQPGGLLYIHGPKGSGKTHLLQALCRAAVDAGQRAGYLPLAEFGKEESAVLEGMGNMPLLCLDDVRHVAGEQDWALLLMRLCEQARNQAMTLVLAAQQAPTDLSDAVADLRTRLAWGRVYALQPLDDEARLRALQRRAKARGLELPDEVGQFLLLRSARDLPALMTMLEQLDTASLAAQRRLTIPFVKQVLAL